MYLQLLKSEKQPRRSVFQSRVFWGMALLWAIVASRWATQIHNNFIGIMIRQSLKGRYRAIVYMAKEGELVYVKPIKKISRPTNFNID